MIDFAYTRSLFHLPQGIIYLNGNSLGPLPRAAVARVSSTMREEWGDQLIGAWNQADWINQPTHIGDRIAKLVGAPAGAVVLGDSLSIKVYQALASALEINAERRVILSDSGNFPGDLYMAQGLIKALGAGHQLQLCEADAIESALSEEVAVLLLTEVDYKTGRLHDMTSLTRKAHQRGILTIWDLAHSAGALPVRLSDAAADFAVGCSYKFLNGGPGSPAFIYLAPELADIASPALCGWLGHDKPFAFDLEYRAAPGIERMRVGTPAVLQMASLAAALDIWDLVDIEDVRQKSIELADLFITEVARRCPELELAGPRDASKRGSQVSFRFSQGFAVIRALAARGVIGDFRAPDIMRFGIAPLYNDAADVLQASSILETVMGDKLWDREAYVVQPAVT